MKALFCYILCLFLFKSYLFGSEDLILKKKEQIEQDNKILKDLSKEKEKKESVDLKVATESELKKPSEKKEKTVAETYKDILKKIGSEDLILKKKEQIEQDNKILKDLSQEKEKKEGVDLKPALESELKKPAEKEEKTVAESYSDIFANTVEEQNSFQEATAIKPNSCPPLELSLELVFNYIEAENLTVLLNREAIEEALQNAYFARADLLPQVSLRLSQNRSRIVNDFGSGDTTFSNSLFNAQITGSLVVFDLTKIAGYQQAKMGIKISTFNYNAILQQVLTAAGTSYFTHIKNLRGLNVIDANLEEAKLLLDLAKTRFNVGVASPIDVTRAEVQVAIYERQRLEQQVLIKQSELNIKRLLDIDTDQIIIIPSIKLAKDLPEPSISPPPLNSVLVNRYDYLKSAEILALNQYQAKTANWAYYPSVSLEPGANSWGFATPWPFEGRWAPEWSVTLTLSMPIFDGFRIRSDILRKESIVRQQKDALLDLANTINTEISLNAFALETRYKQIGLVRRQVALAEQELQLAKTRFKEGVADNLEVVNAQTSLALAADDLVEIVFLYDNARLEWARTLGDVRLILTNGN